MRQALRLRLQFNALRSVAHRARAAGLGRAKRIMNNPVTRRSHPAFLAIFVFVLAPVGAAVVVSAMLLFGLHPRVVFAPGWAVKSLFEHAGIHAPNAIGVASTVGLWWVLFVVAGLAWERRKGS